MEAVLLLDQRLSREASDRVDEWAKHLNEAYLGGLKLPFVRTAGDEMQALTNDPSALVGVIMEAVEDGGWWVGVGLGNVEHPLGITTRESRGTAFWLAREALDRAKARRATRPLVLRAEEPEGAKDLDASLHALGFILSRRTRRQREVAMLFRDDWKVDQIATEWAVKQQAVRQLLQAAGAEEEHEMRQLACRLAATVLA
ncbi:MAG TPA: SatD family protein [Solirubrobacteraceae bacterium]|nr:SatD family protein [Solirubrobacteraceae bacterium]